MVRYRAVSQRKIAVDEHVEDGKSHTANKHTTVHHHTHLVLKVDIRFESGEDLNNV